MVVRGELAVAAGAEAAGHLVPVFRKQRREEHCSWIIFCFCPSLGKVNIQDGSGLPS